MYKLILRRICSGVFGLGVALISSQAMAVGCNADEIEVYGDQYKIVAMAAGCNADEVEIYRDSKKIVCKDREEYVACIKETGAQMKRDLSQNCGRIYKDCFEQKSLDLSLAAAGCLASALAGCGPGQVACAAACNVLFTTTELAAYHSCSVDVTPCYESALAHDKERKELCKQ